MWLPSDLCLCDESGKLECCRLEWDLKQFGFEHASDFLFLYTLEPFLGVGDLRLMEIAF